MPDAATYLAYSPEPFGRIGRPRPPGRCRYPGCEEAQDLDMVTCLQHPIAYRELRHRQVALERKEKRFVDPETPREKILCQRAGCGGWFTPRKGRAQTYCDAACRRIAETLARRQQDLELARLRKENKERRQAEAKARGLCEEDLLAQKIDEYWERVKDPTYYDGVRYRNYSTLLDTGATTRLRAKSATTGGAG